MKPKLNQRREADKTRATILKAATRLFAKKGFKGTSTAEIAKAAKVNEALIFHHFGNKAQLWKKVKLTITETSRVSAIHETPASLREFLHDVIQQRLILYDQNPALHKIKQWQQLEEKNGELSSENILAPNTWIPAIRYLQQQDQVNKSLSAELIVLWLTASINVIIQDESRLFHRANKRKEYITLLMDGFLSALK